MAAFEDLTVWNRAKRLTVLIYGMMQSCNDYGFRDQIQRAAVSIMNNVSEGSESGSNQTYVKFLLIARGSCAEVRSMLYLANELGYCSAQEAKHLINECQGITGALNKLIDYFRKLDTDTLSRQNPKNNSKT